MKEEKEQSRFLAPETPTSLASGQSSPGQTGQTQNGPMGVLSFPALKERHTLSSSCCHSVAKSCLTLRPHRPQHARLPCSSLLLGVFSDSRPSGQRCYPTISSLTIPFAFCPQPFPASGSFPMSQLFTSGGQSTGASASASVLPINIQG